MKMKIEIGSCPSEYRVFCGDHEITNIWVEHIEVDNNIFPPKMIARIKLMREEEVEKKRMGVQAARQKDIYNGKRQILREQRFANEQKKKFEDGIEYPEITDSGEAKW